MSAPDISTLSPGVWNIDSSHTEVGFVVRHVMISKVRGRFSDISGNLTIASPVTDSSVTATIGLASINTDDEKRDEHLRSEDFFNVAKNPSMIFSSTGVRADGKTWKLTGDLSLNGVTKGVELELEFNGVGQDPWGGTRAGFTATTEINRKDFGLTWNVAIEAGGFVVGDTIKIELEIEAIRQA